jgi:hypothetical protein
VAERHPEAVVIVPPRSGAVPSQAAETAPTPRDRRRAALAHGRVSGEPGGACGRRTEPYVGTRNTSASCAPGQGQGSVRLRRRSVQQSDWR